MTDEKTALHLYRTHRVALTQYARRIASDPAQAEDVVQEAWLKLQHAPDAALIRDPLGYLYRIVRNLAVDTRRRALREARVLVPRAEAEAEQTAADDPSPEAQAIGKEDIRAMAAAMAELPERTRIALEMHRFGGCTFKEIAAHLGISVGLAHALVIDGIEHCRMRLCRPAPSTPPRQF